MHAFNFTNMTWPIASENSPGLEVCHALEILGSCHLLLSVEMLRCSVHRSNDDPPSVLSPWSAQLLKAVSLTATARFSASRHVLPKYQVANVVLFEHMKPHLEEKFDNQETKNYYQGKLLQLTLFDKSYQMLP